MRFRWFLLGGPVFAVLWFVAAQILFFAAGGTVDSDAAISLDQYPGAVLGSEANVHAGATLLVLAAVGLALFASALRSAGRPRSPYRSVGSIALIGVVLLVMVEAGLVLASLTVAEQTPEVAWGLYETSGVLGFESFITALFGAVAVGGTTLSLDRAFQTRWFWWASVILAVVLAIGGLLEGFGITTEGRFAILFALWTFVAGFGVTLSSSQEAQAHQTRDRGPT